MNTLVSALILLVAVHQDIGDVTSSFDKNANFSTLHTYAWSKGHEAYDPAAHKIIVEAIDAQMTSLGFTKAEAGTADTILKYHAVGSSYTDLDQLDELQSAGQKAPVPNKMLGMLLVVLYPAGSTTTPLWQARTRRVLSDDAATRTEEVRSAVASVFDTYPGRKKSSK